MSLRNSKKRTRRFVVDGKKECADCLETKPVSEFGSNKKGKQAGVVFSRCKECKRARDRAYYKNNPRIQNNSAMKSQYGITLDEYDQLFEDQKGVCAICKNKISDTATASGGYKRKRLDIDHCHKTGRIRGLLCRRCNTGIGQFQNDPNRLREAAEYLCQ